MVISFKVLNKHVPSIELIFLNPSPVLPAPSFLPSCKFPLFLQTPSFYFWAIYTWKRKDSGELRLRIQFQLHFRITWGAEGKSVVLSCLSSTIISEIMMWA